MAEFRCAVVLAALVAHLDVVGQAAAAVPHWFDDQLVDHFSSSAATWRQRFYMNDEHFAGPGSPIFVVLGGEGGIPPSVGIFYPWVVDVLAKTFHALVIEPEHRFYGESLPFGNRSFEQESLHVMNSQQALADAARFVLAHQRSRNCTARGTKGYCPVLTIGGSYPGFLSAMMRLRYPAIVDMAYAASAPMKFYSQEVDQYAYYARVTASAERSMAGCAEAVRGAFDLLANFTGRSSLEKLAKNFSLCSPLPDSVSSKEQLADDLTFLAQQTFANLNMANYPPTEETGLHRTCESFVAAARKGEEAPLAALRALLLGETQAARQALAVGRALITVGPQRGDAGKCFDLSAQLPAGPHATARCGDWSGCGVGRDGEMWDYQTCTFEVERIGFGSPSQMFPPRPWTTDWLRKHCATRFAVQPRPHELNSLWGFDEENLRAQASRIVFTNGLNDGWSVGGILRDLAPEKGLVAVNLPNGAHHSDLGHGGAHDTPDVKEAHEKLVVLIGRWIGEVKEERAQEVDDVRAASEAIHL